MRPHLSKPTHSRLAVWVAVTAILSAGSVQAAVHPAAPSGLQVVHREPAAITLTWRAVSGASSYGLWVGGRNIGTTEQHNHRFSGLLCGRTYTLGVRSRRGPARSTITHRLASTLACPVPAPSVQSSPVSGAQTTSDTATVTFTDTHADVTFTCSIDGGQPTNCTSPMTYSDLSVGTHIVSVRARTAIAQSPAASVTWTVTNADGSAWSQVFFDNFSQLDQSAWGAYSGEPGGDPGGLWDPSHAVVTNGLLDLRTYRDPAFGNRWVSAGVSNDLHQTYGKYEVRFRVDGGQGVNAVLLLWPVADVWPPEIDFAENGGESSVRDSMSATLHYATANHQIQRSLSADFTAWHVMGVEWTPGKLVYTIDGAPWATVSDANVPAIPMEMDIQSEAGTCGDQWAPCPTSATPAEVDLQVDWVRIYSYNP